MINRILYQSTHLLSSKFKVKLILKPWDFEIMNYIYLLHSNFIFYPIDDFLGDSSAMTGKREQQLF